MPGLNFRMISQGRQRLCLVLPASLSALLLGTRLPPQELVSWSYLHPCAGVMLLLPSQDTLYLPPYPSLSHFPFSNLCPKQPTLRWWPTLRAVTSKARKTWLVLPLWQEERVSLRPWTSRGTEYLSWTWKSNEKHQHLRSELLYWTTWNHPYAVYWKQKVLLIQSITCPCLPLPLKHGTQSHRQLFWTNEE